MVEEVSLFSDSEVGGGFDGAADRCQAPQGRPMWEAALPLLKPEIRFFLQQQEEEEEEVQVA